MLLIRLVCGRRHVQLTWDQMEVIRKSMVLGTGDFTVITEVLVQLHIAHCKHSCDDSIGRVESHVLHGIHVRLPFLRGECAYFC